MTGKGNKTWAEKFAEIVEMGQKDIKSIILANTQLFEEKVVKSGLEVALPAIREDIGMLPEGFKNKQDANIWFYSVTLSPEVSSKRQTNLENWINIIQREFRLTDNYRSAIKFYILTAQIGEIQPNASVEVDLIKNEVKVIRHAVIRGDEKKYLEEITEHLYHP